jgi:hypothetical protein
MCRLFTDSTFSTTLRAVLAVFAILTGSTGIGTFAGRGENIDLIEEKYRQQHLSDDRED